METVSVYPLGSFGQNFAYSVYQAILVDRRTRCRCYQCSKSSINLHILQWQSRCFCSMNTVSKYESILLGMDHWRWNHQFLLWIKRFYNISHFFTLYLTTRLLTLRSSTSGYILYTFRPTSLTATAETSNLEDINIIICIRANFLYIASAGLHRLHRFDTLEHWWICMPFILFYDSCLEVNIYPQNGYYLYVWNTYFSLQRWRSGKQRLCYTTTWVWNILITSAEIC